MILDMTLIQIGAIISLLIAFGFPVEKTEEIRAILENRPQITQVKSMDNPVEIKPEIKSFSVQSVGFRKHTKGENKDRNYTTFIADTDTITLVILSNREGIIETVEPKIDTVYTDGKFKYVAFFSKDFEGVFKIVLKSKDRAEYVSPEWRAYVTTEGELRYEECVADYCK